MTNRLRSFARRVITSSASASAAPPRVPVSVAAGSTNGITAMEARRCAAVTLVAPGAAAGGGSEVEVCTLGAGVSSCFGGRPGIVQRGGIEAFGFEQAGAGRKMFLAFTDLAAPHEGSQKLLMDTAVERSQLDPFLQELENVVVRRIAHELFQHGDMAARNRRRCAASQAAKAGARSISSPSRNSPVNDGASSRSRSGESVVDAFLLRTRDGDHVHRAVIEMHRDRVSLRVDAPLTGIVDKAADLAEAPAQLTSGIVRNVPKEVAQPASGNRVWREDQITEEGLHFA